ncbi:MAG: TRAP transporter substrate-binding protein [Gammaproteobacteria bacterium]|nr:TRAP transporter substrate-binding protein [Gammaproteobacteria bacterium]
MKRRDVLSGAGAAALGVAAPAVGQSVRHLTMVTDWPDGPGVLPSARRLARSIQDASDGRIRIEVTPSGAVVRPFETFDAVSAGVADMFHSHIGYFENKSPVLHFWSGLPFGMTANELFAWVHFGGGRALWDEVVGPFDIKPLLASSTGAQMGGWFREPLDSVEAIDGLRYRMAEPGAEVFRRLGATVVVVPGADIVQSLESGAIDACEWLGPWLDTAMGLDRVARYYYYPSWHEPGTVLALGINRRVWESFGERDRRLVESACAAEFMTALAEFNTNNARALKQLRDAGRVSIRRFGNDIVAELARISREVVTEKGAADELAGRVLASYADFLGLARSWSDVGEGAYLSLPNPW